MNTQVEEVKDVEIEKKVMPIPTQAKLIIVRDQTTLSKANEFFLIIRQLRKEVAEGYDDLIKKAHEAHKLALAKKAKYEAPLIEAETYLNGQVTAYHQEIEKRRRQEEEMARQRAIKEEMERRKKEEEDRLAQAAALEEVGAVEEAQAIIDETIEENSKPVEVYTPPPETPKARLDGMTIVKYWSAEVTDLRALVKAVAEGKQPLVYLQANMPPLNRQAESLKEELRIPGVKAIWKSSAKSTGKRTQAIE